MYPTTRSGGASLALLALLALLLQATPDARGADPSRPTGGSPPLGLPAALRLAAERSVDLQSARADLSQAEATRLAASQLANPALSYSTTKIPTDGTSAATELGNGFYDRSYDTVVSLSQPFEIGGKRSARRRSAEAGLDAARARLDGTGRSVLADTLRAYVSAVAARRSAGMLDDISASLEKSAALARVREEGGEISRAEKLQVEVAAGRFRADAEAAAARARSATVALQGLLGLAERDPELALSTTLEEAQALTASLSPPPGGDASLDADVLEKRPDVAAARAAVRRAEADASLQRAFRIPDPSLLVQYEREPPDRSNSVGFGVSIPLPAWNRNAAGIRSAEAALESARADTRRTEERARTELASTRAALAAAEARLVRYERDLVPRAARAREAVAFAWSEGGASLVELLEAERSAADVALSAAGARSDLLSARADWAVARALPLLPEESR